MKLRSGRGTKGDESITPENVQVTSTDPQTSVPETTAQNYQAEQTNAGKGRAVALRAKVPKRHEPPSSESDDETKPSANTGKRRKSEGQSSTTGPAQVSENTPPKTSQSSSTLRFSPQPPITEFRGDQITTMLEQLEENLSGWKVLSSDTQSTERSSSKDMSAEQEAWNKRVDDVVDKINAGFIAAYTEDTVAAYSVNEKPVGMLIITNADIPYVTQMATHPGQTGAGGALMEQAVNTSVRWGAEGKVRLKPQNAGVAAIYETWGFKRVPTGMELDPKDNDKWIMQDGDYRLKKYQDQPYLTGFGNQEPPEPKEQQ
jgi:hypothetical protein